ncbi:hypothetical protein [Streptomyces aidingensis]|uniref:Secreted protein n=1 Tax=Streptomyces aidingensis TaxID=910347 RepID=A0A1I1JFQ0_9ACTN|nr:hypothetical protein [Streptomyces aidingensis]SFC45448.1 hypothetical protein SAMN05421773_103340 [Streptomyces aidingensis]
MRGKKAIGAGALALALVAGAGWAAQAATDDTAAGRTAPAGAPAAAAVDGYEIVTLPNANVPNFERRTLYCPPGKVVIGGGAEAQGEGAVLVGSFPTDDATGWIGLGRQDAYPDVGISVYAICAYP